MEVHNVVAQLANNFETNSHTSAKKSGKPPTHLKNCPPQNINTYPSQNANSYPYPAPYSVPTQNRYTSLDTRSSEYGYQYYIQGPNQYQFRPPRGNFRGNFRGRPLPYQNYHQRGGGWRGWKEPYRIPPTAPQYPKEHTEQVVEEAVEIKRKRTIKNRDFQPGQDSFFRRGIGSTGSRFKILHLTKMLTGLNYLLT